MGYSVQKAAQLQVQEEDLLEDEMQGNNPEQKPDQTNDFENAPSDQMKPVNAETQKTGKEKFRTKVK